MGQEQLAPMRGGIPELAQPAQDRPAPRAGTDHLDGAQKSAIIVRWLIAEGLDLPLAELPETMQAQLAQAMGSMRLIDRQTMAAVIEEFVETLDQVGLSFPEGLDGALSMIGAQLGDQATGRLRALSQGGRADDPWAHIETVADDILGKLLTTERPAVGAVILSRLSIAKSARLLEGLPPDLAQKLALTVASIDTIPPESVTRIGDALVQQLKSRPVSAFTVAPARRMGNILNSTPAPLRIALLDGIEAQDAQVARDIRKAIFTFEDLPQRLAPGDVPVLVRATGIDPLVTIRTRTLAEPGTRDAAAMDYLLQNMSKRLAEGLNDDASMVESLPHDRALSEAILQVMNTLRQMVDGGEIELLAPPEEED